MNIRLPFPTAALSKTSCHSYFSIICKVGFTILSQAATEVSLTAERRIPIFSIKFLGGRGKFLSSFAFICLDFEIIEMNLSYIVELSSAKSPNARRAHISEFLSLVSI